MDKRKKILFLVTQSEFGGAQRFIYTLTNSLGGYDVVVGAGPEGDDENGLLSLLEKRGIKIERLKNLRRSINPLFDLLGLFEIKKLIEKQQPNILFLCSTKAGFLGSLANRFLHHSNKRSDPTFPTIPAVIYRIGGWSFNDPWPKWKKRLYVWLEKFSAKWKNIIVNNSESDKQQAIKLGIKPKKEIIVIHNGIDAENLEFFSKEESRFRISEILKLNQNSKLEIQDFVVGTIANNYPTKGIKYLKEAVAKIQDAKCVIIGKGNLFLPDAYKYLKAFDVFVLSSVKEGFPWVILEATAAEIPIIATKVGAVPEIIKDGESGLLIDPAEPEQIVEAVQKLLKDEELQNKLVNNAKRTVIEKFNLSKMVQKYEDLFLVD